MKLFSKSCSTEENNCTLCSIYMRIGLFCLGTLWLCGNIELLWALQQQSPIPSNAATQMAFLGNLLIPAIIFIRILYRKRKTS